MREIKGYEGLYVINEDSIIIGIKTGRTRKVSIGNHGYCTIDLYKNNKRKTLLVHRLMAETFISNPENKPTVNHKDGNKLNNKLTNLEWATYAENHKHSYDKLNRKAYLKGKLGRLNHNSKPIFMVSMDGIDIKRYDSIADAERETRILNNGIVACLKGRNKSAGGFKWRYENAS